MVSVVSSPTAQIAQIKTVLVLWSKPATQNHADAVVRHINGKFACYDINAELAHDENATTFTEQSKKAIKKSDFYFFVVHPEFGPENGSYSDLEYQHIIGLQSRELKSKDSLRYITTVPYEMDKLESALLGQEIFCLDEFLASKYDEKIINWLGIPSSHQRPLEYPDHDYVVQSPKIAALIWTLQFEKIQQITTYDGSIRIDRDCLIKQAVRQMAVLKTLHSVHSTIGPAMKELLSMLQPRNSELGPHIKDLKKGDKIRNQMVRYWEDALDDSKRNNFYECLEFGLIPILQSFRLRTVNSEHVQSINEFVDISRTIQIKRDIHQVKLEFVNDISRLKYFISLHSKEGILMSDSLYESIKNGVKTNRIDKFWNDVLLHSEEFYKSFFDFMLVIALLFGTLKIQQPWLSEREKEHLENSIDIIENIEDYVHGVKKEAIRIQDNLVKRSNALIIDYIMALEDLFEESHV